MADRDTPWYPLDNAGTLYSSLQKERYSAIYRFSAWMTQEVDPEALQRAIDKTLPRFPSFGVRMKRGVFWYYLEPNQAPGPFVKEDVADPCQPVRFKEDNGWLVRFYYYRHRISIEVFHALSDGTGGLIFFRTLLAVYLRELGHPIPNGNGVLDVEEPPRKEEREDAYLRYAGPVARAPHLMKKAYQNLGAPEPFYTFHVTMGFVPVDRVKERAKSMGVSITEYLAAVLMRTLMEKQRREHTHRELPIALSVPVDLRAFFPSQTVRNFIQTVQPVIDPNLGDWTLEEIAQRVHHYMRLNVTAKELQSVFTRNVRYQRNRALRTMPRPLKDPVVAFNYRNRGVKPYSAVFTNPGLFKVPTEMAPFIDHMEVVLGQATVARPHVSSISYGNVMEITFAGTQKDAETEREFFCALVREGIPVKIESNRPQAGRGD